MEPSSPRITLMADMICVRKELKLMLRKDDPGNGASNIGWAPTKTKKMKLQNTIFITLSYFNHHVYKFFFDKIWYKEVMFISLLKDLRAGNISTTRGKRFTEGSHHYVHVSRINSKKFANTCSCIPNGSNAMSFIQINICLYIYIKIKLFYFYTYIRQPNWFLEDFDIACEW